MFVNPYDCLWNEAGTWLKANFHTHAGKDGDYYDISEVLDLYKEAGYDILTISNQGVLSDIEKYVLQKDMVLFNGFEYTEHEDMLCIDVNRFIKGGHQDVIDEVVKQKGFVILCHPNWKDRNYWKIDEMCRLKGYMGIEICNSLIFKLKGSGLATDDWDYLLSAGKLVWGFANDDFHRWFDMGRAWNMIYSQSKEHADIKDSLMKGSFYASTGLCLKSLSFKNNVIEVAVDSDNTYVKEYRYIFIGENGRILSDQKSEHGVYKLTGDERYVRIQAISEHGAMLWSQPLYDNERLWANW